MIIIEPHIHMLSRTTNDYQAMFAAGIRCCVEPSFWMGSLRRHAGSFFDYFDLILDYETVRGERFGIDHWSCIAINPKESDNAELAREAISGMEKYLDHPRCICVGEIGFNEITKNEEVAFVRQLHMGEARRLPIMIHTPHRNKKKGAERIIEILRAERVTMERILIDHNTEETIGLSHALDCWSGMTVYPYSKLDPVRVINILKEHGTERMMVNSSADWGVSEPTALRRTADNMKLASFTEDEIETVVFKNPLAFYSQCERFKPRLNLEPLPIESFQR